jgi:cellulose biosynthesis protein BcsQ
MLTIAIASLSGGQGKTTAALMLGRLLSRQATRLYWLTLTHSTI